MAISAASTGKNRIYISSNPRTIFEDAKAVVSSASDWKQGDLLYFDDSANVIKSVTATGNAATFLGIADNSVTDGKLVGPYDGLTAVDAAQAISSLKGPVAGVIAKLKLKASDAFNPGDKVYLADGQDSQTVSVTDPGDANYIGTFVDTAVASAASGQEAQIRLYSRFPALSVA